MKRVFVCFMVLFMVQISVYADDVSVAYSVHMANVGWGGYSSDGETAGTTGQSRRIEAVKMKITPSDVSGGIRYNVHVQDVGWMGWSENDEVAGTTGQSRQLEAIRVTLTGDLRQQYTVRYRVHMANVGWSGWYENGEDAGTTGQKRQLEAIEVRLVKR